MYSVGFYKPDGQWTPESDYKTIAEAADRVSYLNGAKKQEAIEITQLKRDTRIIKLLDADLIRRANDSSTVFNFGDGLAQRYEKDVLDIYAMKHLNDDEQAAAMVKVHALRTNELEKIGRAIDPYTYGPAVINHDRDRKTFDAASKAKAEADTYMKSLRMAEDKYRVQENKRTLVDAIRTADEKGMKEITINNKTWYKLRNNWTTRQPKLIKLEI